MGGFQPKNIIFSDLPKPTEGNFFTALGQGMDGVANVELYREAQDKKDAIEAQNALVREEQLKSTKQQIEINTNTLGDAERLKNLGGYDSYDAFIKDNPLTNPHNMKASQDFYEGKQAKINEEQSQTILNELRANNGGKLPTRAQLNAQLPALIGDKEVPNKALGMVFQSVDAQETLDLDRAYKQSGITLHNAQAAAALNKERSDPNAKERSTYWELVKSGEIDPKVTEFGTWLSQSNGGKLTVRSESVTSARNKGRDQLAALSQITGEFLPNHDPKNHGLWDGMWQGLKERVGIQGEESAQLESDRIGLSTAGATGIFGGKPTNKQTEMAENMIGGAFQTEKGTAGKIKSVLNQSILSTEETIRQIESSKGDARDLKEELFKYKTIARNLEDWDGTEPASKYLDLNYTPKKKENGGAITSLRDKNLVTSTETNITQNVTGQSVMPSQPTIVRTGIDPTNNKKVLFFSDGSSAYGN